MTKENQHKQWEERIKAYESSGKTQNQWCIENNINLRTLSYWLSKLNKTSKKQTSRTKINWVPVNTSEKPDKTNTSAITIKIGGASICIGPGFNSELLVDIINVLKNIC